MKSLVFVVVVAFVAVIQAELTPEQKEKLLAHHKKCSEESGVQMEQVKKVKAGDWSDEDPALKKHAFCMLKAIGILDVNGQFEKDTFYAKLPATANKEKAEAAVNACLAEARPPTNEEYAWNLLKCYHSKNSEADLV